MSPVTLGGLTLLLHGEARWLASLPPNFLVNREGEEVGQSFVLDQRFRLGGGLEGKGWKVYGEGDFFSGQLLGDSWDIPGEVDERERGEMGVLDGFWARQAYIEGRVGPMLVTGGLQTSHWGLGMIANDGGSHDAEGNARDPLFGRSDFGDRVLRLRVATRPLGKDDPLSLIMAFDRVVADELARWDQGQAAYQGLVAGLHATETARAGLYLAYRDQTEADGERKTRVLLVDATAQRSGTFTAHTWALGFEGVVVGGETSRARSYNSPERLSVASAGATGFASMSRGPATLTLRSGIASGDGDPDDDESHDFAFDRDFDVGMVLFDEYQGALEAATYNELADPEHAGQVPDGAEVVVSEGAFRRAAFLQPVLSIEAGELVEVRVGSVFAWATAPIVEPFNTYRNGGTPTNQIGIATDGRWLGAELDWAVEVEAPAGWAVRPAAVLQGGYAIPSEANGNPGRAWETLHTATVRARW